MDHTKYMGSAQMNEFMWLSATRQIFDRLLDTTKDKNWRRKIKTCDTLLKQVMEERWADMEPLEQKKAWRRIENKRIKVYAYDDAKVDHEDTGRTYTISQEDFMDLVDGASLNCMSCPQGDVVKDCPRRKLFHRLGLAVHALRENPEAGQCEFRYNDEQYAVTPQYRKCEKEIIEQLP